MMHSLRAFLHFRLTEPLLRFTHCLCTYDFAVKMPYTWVFQRHILSPSVSTSTSVLSLRRTLLTFVSRSILSSWTPPTQRNEALEGTARLADNAHVKGKGKAVPLQAWSGPEGSSKLRFPDYMTTAQNGGKVVSLTHPPPLPPTNAPGNRFC
jgi:hypothetical protein